MTQRTPAQIIGHDRLAQLVFEGYVVVPAEPTEAMFAAAWKEAQDIAQESGGAVDRDQVIHVTDRYYRAMVRADGETGVASKSEP